MRVEWASSFSDLRKSKIWTFNTPNTGQIKRFDRISLSSNLLTLKIHIIIDKKNISDPSPSRTGKGVFAQRRWGPTWSEPTSNDMRTTLHTGLYILRKSALTPSSGWPNFALTPYFIVKPKRWISWRSRTYRQFFIQKAQSPVQVHWTLHTYNDYFVKSGVMTNLDCAFSHTC